MRACQVAFAAAIFFGGAADATASPLIAPLSAAVLHAKSGPETVRWRHGRHRGFSWSGRGDSTGRGETDGFSASTATRGPNGAVPSAGSEIFRLDAPRRRGWVDPPSRR
jgi:hypothetical protein